MGQARKIYEYMVRSDNLAADDALLLAYQRAQPPYHQVLMETLLDRAAPTGTCPLIESFHLFSPVFQQLLIDRVEALFAGLSRSAHHVQAQVRLNVLTIIKRANYFRLAELAAYLLRDRDRRVVNLSIEILQQMARCFIGDREITKTPLSTLLPLKQADERAVHRQYFLFALQKAMMDYRVHRCDEILLAAMYIAPADWDKFWQSHLHYYNPAGQAIGRFLLNITEPALADFCLSALRYRDLRSPAARGISNCRQRAVVIALARCYDAGSDELVDQGLKLVKNPVWLNGKILTVKTLPLADQSAMLDFIAAVGAPAQQTAEFISGFITEADEPAILKAVKILSALPAAVSLKPLLDLSASPYEQVVLSAIAEIIRLHPTQLSRIMASQLRSPHLRVRQLAQRYYSKIAFDSYWESFNNLTISQRAVTGGAIFKIDPDVEQRWRSRAASSSPFDRLRAVQIVRLARRCDGVIDVLCRLTGDADCVVRSSAVAALGESRSLVNDPVESCLLHALSDSNGRVVANAIEAMERLNMRQGAPRIALLLNSDNNRVRANAIKALANWQNWTIAEPIRAMLTDPRPQHRRSAYWVIRQVQFIKDILSYSTGSSKKTEKVNVGSFIKLD